MCKIWYNKPKLFRYYFNLINFMELDTILRNSCFFLYLGKQDWNFWWRESPWDIPNDLDAVSLVEAGQVRYKGT